MDVLAKIVGPVKVDEKDLKEEKTAAPSLLSFEAFRTCALQNLDPLALTGIARCLDDINLRSIGEFAEHYSSGFFLVSLAQTFGWIISNLSWGALVYEIPNHL